MKKWTESIDKLDIKIFESIPSQTSNDDRRSLLAVQRATARKYKEYIYLEIGSYLGGSIQPHLIDDRCKKIYSIDSRPSDPPDERTPGRGYHYHDNSAERMLTLLRGVGSGDLGKIECIDMDASKVDAEKIVNRPQLAFIDGEHTKSAVHSDFRFCSKIVDGKGAILFHDFDIIWPAILEICELLEKQNRVHLPLKLEGSVFGIFFDRELVSADAYLASLCRRQRSILFVYRFTMWLKRWLPIPMLNALRRLRNSVRKTAGLEH